MSEDESDTISDQIDTLLEEYMDLRKDLRETGPSSVASIERTFNKVMLISAASRLEADVKVLIYDIFSENNQAQLAAFVQTNILSRGYHTLFSWKDQKATSFFSALGKDAKDEFTRRCRADPDYKSRHDAFMYVGAKRNELVHNDYIRFPYDDTVEEIYNKYLKAKLFVEDMRSALRGESVPAVG